MVQYCTGVVQRELKSTLKSGPIIREKERRKYVRETAKGAKNSNQRPIALWPTAPACQCLSAPARPWPFHHSDPHATS